MEIKSLHELLDSVSVINEKFETIAIDTGENFNIFRILKIERKEVRMHSALLTELFNAVGKHSCGDRFIKLFIEMQKKKQEMYPDFVKKINDFIPEKSTATLEFDIGYINEDGTKGGRIDIVIRDINNYEIIIENKIDAKDQEKQLIRYNGYNEKAPIFYLTLTGYKPSENSRGNMKEGNEFVCISYENDILNWLEECKSETKHYSILKETITQYINLIKYLTGQTMNKIQENEIIEKIVSNKEHINIALQLAELSNGIKRNIFEKLKEEVQKIADDLNLKCAFDDLDIQFGDSDSYVEFYKESWDNVKIVYYFTSNDNLLVALKSINKSENDRIFERVMKFTGNGKSKCNNTSEWIYESNFNKWKDTPWHEKLLLIPSAIKKDIENKINILEDEPKIPL